MKIVFKDCAIKECGCELMAMAISEKDLTGSGFRKTSPLAAVPGLKGIVPFERLKRAGFKGREGEELVTALPGKRGITDLMLLGCRNECSSAFESMEQCRRLGSAARKAAKKTGAKSAGVIGAGLNLNAGENKIALMEGAILAGYEFKRYRSEAKDKNSALKELAVLTGEKLSPKEKRKVECLCEGTALARDLVNMPAKDCGPRYLLRKAREIAGREKLKIEVLRERELKRIKAGGILSVSRASSEPAYLIKLIYRPQKKAHRKISLVGKGITFDSGGLSIKTGEGMMEMKMDMAGAAAVLGVMSVISRLKPRVEVRAYLPVCENMISGNASKPGDIISTVNGKTIEVLNTDAEGRLILADALALAAREKADEIVDLATLTGACVVALGLEYAGLFSTDKSLKDGLLRAGELGGERLWPLPLAKEYRRQIESTVADIKNIGNRSEGAGTITAALFLREFVGDTPWAHLDIAGPAFSHKDYGYIRKGGVGFGVRTVANYLSEL